MEARIIMTHLFLMEKQRHRKRSHILHCWRWHPAKETGRMEPRSHTDCCTNLFLIPTCCDQGFSNEEKFMKTRFQTRCFLPKCWSIPKSLIWPKQCHFRTCWSILYPWELVLWPGSLLVLKLISWLRDLYAMHWLTALLLLWFRCIHFLSNSTVMAF